MSVQPQDELNELFQEPITPAMVEPAPTDPIPVVEVREDVKPVDEVVEEEEEVQEEVAQKPEPKPEKKKMTFEERQAQISQQIKEKHGIQRQLEAEREQIRKEREELEALRRQLTPQEDIPPDITKYDGREAQYVEDYTDWKAAQKVKAQQQQYKAEAEQRAAQEETQKFVKDWETKTEIRIQKDPSFAEREQDVVRVMQLHPNKAMYEAIMESENNVDLVDYLGKNLEECLHIASLRGSRAATAIGRIEERIQGRKSPAVTKAPAPLSTVRSTGSGGIRDIRQIDDFDEYSRQMNKKLYG